MVLKLMDHDLFKLVSLLFVFLEGLLSHEGDLVACDQILRSGFSFLDLRDSSVVFGWNLFVLEELGSSLSFSSDDLVSSVAFKVKALVSSFLLELLLLFLGEDVVMFFLLLEER